MAQHRTPSPRDFDFVPDAIVAADRQGRITMVNRQAETMFGYSRRELLGESIEVLLPDRFREGHIRHRARYASKPSLRPMGAGLELYGRRKDGSEFPVDIMLSPFETEDGHLTLSVIRDITERKRAEEELRKARNELEIRVQERTAELVKASEELRRAATIVHDSNDAITVQDFEGSILLWNRAAEWMYGYDKAEALTMNVAQIIPENLREESSVLQERLKKGETIEPFGTQKVTKDGRILNVWLTATALHDESGKPIAIVTTERDITERKRAQEERRKLEEQLKQAQKMEAVGRLAGGVVHDFNNLLTGIMAFIEILLEQLPADDPLREGAEEARKTCERSALLTRQLLAVSRRQALEPIVLDLNSVIADMSKMLQRLISENIDFITVFEPELGRVKADPGKIEQVILNLVLNARDAMLEGGRLTIETANVDVDEEYARQRVGVHVGPHVMLAVSDTGIGMDEETMAHIFEPFFTTKERDKGTGLGLATVYGIVKQSGGDIRVYSEPGQGSTFKIYFPVVAEIADRVEPVQPVAGDMHGSETVLVVEDDPVVRITVSEILRSHGYTVLEAGHGEDALLACQRQQGAIHLLMTDVVMPRMSGPELAERLALLRPETRVLYMSAHMLDALTYRRVLERGNAFLEKPFTRASLLRKVREVLGAPPASR